MTAAEPRGPVFLTGASGFVGGHVLRSLVAAGYPVRALVRPGSRPPSPMEGCTVVEGDLLRPGELVSALEGCEALMHVAALYSFSPGSRAAIRETNVRGTAGILEAARIAGVRRAVVTSSSATVGPARDGIPATEADWAPRQGGTSRYHESKIEQERAALAARVPAVLVLPTAPVGPGDWRPTPTGKMIVDFMRGRIFASLGGGLNVVPVEDVATAHLLALEKGQPRERYLVGGENLPLAELWRRLAVICGRRAPRTEIPYALALALGWGDELRCRVPARAGRSSADPIVPLEGVHMARHQMYVDDGKARRNLGYAPGPVTAALERAVRWYADRGYAG